jgi:hypothetical protein
MCTTVLSRTPDAGRVGVQLGLPPRCCYRLTPSFRAHLGLRRDVEVNRLDLVRTGTYDVIEQPLNNVQTVRLHGK